ncbi:hypothetical protein EIP86_011304 [Pleurotus ostreatoroseus]|nr:hypothetical protein EIP86_011304 [Pleurotus ostreatoroseus]
MLEKVSFAQLYILFEANLHPPSKYFLRLEEESALRALKEEELERLQAQAEGRPTAQELADKVLPSWKLASVTASSEWRRISVDIPRSEDPPSSRWSCSTTSLCSLGSTDTASSHTLADPEDLAAVTTVCVLKRSFIKTLYRRLSRARNTLPLPLHILDSRDDLVIAVSVEEATTVVPADENSLHAEPISTAVAYSPEPCAMNVVHEKSSTGWVSKAKCVKSWIKASLL